MKKINILRLFCVLTGLWCFYLGGYSGTSFNAIESILLWTIMTISLATLQLTFTLKDYYE